MPELPDVETFRRYAAKALKKRIKEVSVKQKKIIKVSESTLRKHLLGKRFTGTSRHGKYLFLKISGGSVLVLHFGMTGELAYYRDKDREKGRSRKEDRKEKGKETDKHGPRHIAVEMELSDRHMFAVISVRRLGKIDVAESVEDYISSQDLGKDALSIGKKDFIRFMQESRGSVKSILMDQSKISGLGNIYTDELLFQLGIHPKKKAEDLDSKDYADIFKEMKKVLRTGIRHSGSREKMPKDYLIRKREALSRKKKGADRCPVCGGKLKNTTVGGRSTYYCSKHQKR